MFRHETNQAVEQVAEWVAAGEEGRRSEELLRKIRDLPDLDTVASDLLGDDGTFGELIDTFYNADLSSSTAAAYLWLAVEADERHAPPVSEHEESVVYRIGRLIAALDTNEATTDDLRNGILLDLEGSTAADLMAASPAVDDTRAAEYVEAVGWDVPWNRFDADRLDYFLSRPGIPAEAQEEIEEHLEEQGF